MSYNFLYLDRIVARRPAFTSEPRDEKSKLPSHQRVFPETNSALLLCRRRRENPGKGMIAQTYGTPSAEK